MEEEQSPTKNRKGRKVVSQINPESLLQLELFFQRHKQIFIGKRAHSECF